jgi:hypothetical protein
MRVGVGVLAALQLGLAGAFWPFSSSDTAAGARRWARGQKAEEAAFDTRMVARVRAAVRAGGGDKTPQMCTDWAARHRPPGGGDACSAWGGGRLPESSSGGKLTVDLYVMSGCPWCALQLAYLKPFLQVGAAPQASASARLRGCAVARLRGCGVH